jgi:methylglutaconyl-CoA hydratase
MEFTRILAVHSDRKAVITLNRPDKRNALDDVMVNELTSAFLAAARDQSVRVIVLRAEGTAFCAGADLQYLEQTSTQDLEHNRIDSTRMAYLFRTMYEIRKPIIAAVQGPALAGGCGLAAASDFVLAAKSKARFGLPEVRIGFVPAIVMLFIIKRVGEGRARELAIRGNAISARTAYDLGLVTELAEDAELDGAVRILADELASQNSPTAMGLCKDLFGKLHGMNLLDGLDFAANVNATARMTPDYKQGISAFLKKATPKW